MIHHVSQSLFANQRHMGQLMGCEDFPIHSGNEFRIEKKLHKEKNVNVPTFNLGSISWMASLIHSSRSGLSIWHVIVPASRKNIKIKKNYVNKKKQEISTMKMKDQNVNKKFFLQLVFSASAIVTFVTEYEILRVKIV